MTLIVISFNKKVIDSGRPFVMKLPYHPAPLLITGSISLNVVTPIFLMLCVRDGLQLR